MNRLDEIDNRAESISLQHPAVFDPEDLHRAYLEDIPALLAVVRAAAESVQEGRGCLLCWTEPMYQKGHDPDYDCPLAALLEEVPE